MASKRVKGIGMVRGATRWPSAFLDHVVVVVVGPVVYGLERLKL